MRILGKESYQTSYIGKPKKPTTTGVDSAELAKKADKSTLVSHFSSGAHVTSGGGTGQKYVKNSDNDFDCGWVDDIHIVLTQAEYDALSPPGPNTFYYIQA